MTGMFLAGVTDRVEKNCVLIGSSGIQDRNSNDSDAGHLGYTFLVIIFLPDQLYPVPRK